ncbi:MAG: hypothetical protein U0231_15780 [Nitrospiraceae bacterium]
MTIAIIQALMVEVNVDFCDSAQLRHRSRPDHEVGHQDDQRSGSPASPRPRLPLIQLAQEFDDALADRRDRFYVVVAALGDRRVGIVVDELRSQEKWSSSPSGITSTVKSVSGATITGEARWS